MHEVNKLRRHVFFLSNDLIKILKAFTQLQCVQILTTLLHFLSNLQKPMQNNILVFSLLCVYIITY